MERGSNTTQVGLLEHFIVVGHSLALMMENFIPVRLMSFIFLTRNVKRI